LAFGLSMLACEIPRVTVLGLVSISVWHEVKSGHVEESIGFDGISERGGDSLSASWALRFIIEINNNKGLFRGNIKKILLSI